MSQWQILFAVYMLAIAARTLQWACVSMDFPDPQANIIWNTSQQVCITATASNFAAANMHTNIWHRGAVAQLSALRWQGSIQPCNL